jgi:hypothetical protein
MRRIRGASLLVVDAGDDGNATSLPLRSRRNRKGSTSQSPKAIPDVGNTVIPKLAPLFASLFGDECGGYIRWRAASHCPGGPDDTQSYPARLCRAGLWASLPD